MITEYKIWRFIVDKDIEWAAGWPMPESTETYLFNLPNAHIEFGKIDSSLIDDRSSTLAELDWEGMISETIKNQELIAELERYSALFYTDPESIDPDDPDPANPDDSTAYLKIARTVDNNYQEAFVRRRRYIPIPDTGCQHNFDDYVRSFCTIHGGSGYCHKCGKFRCCAKLDEVEENRRRMEEKSLRFEEKRRRMEEKKRSGLGKKRRHSRKKRHSKKK